jgi:hypothetical protein
MSIPVPYGLTQTTMKLIKKCDKGWPMNCLVSFYIQQYNLQGSVTDEHSIGKTNPSFAIVHGKHS